MYFNEAWNVTLPSWTTLSFFVIVCPNFETPKCIQVPICHQANHTHGIPAIENGYSLSFAHVFTSQCFESTQRLTSFTLILQTSICQYLSSMVSSVTLIVASSFHRYHRCHLTWSICPDAEAMKSALVFRSHFFWAPRRTSSLDI